MLTSIIAFVSAHAVILAGLLVAIIDTAIALSPGLKSNSILQVILPFLQKESGTV